MVDGGKSVYNQTIFDTKFFTKNDVMFIKSVLKKTLTTRIEENKKDQ